jgi:D-alanyl-D-alanine endopeptidase (penicillin-binding protein 7)
MLRNTIYCSMITKKINDRYFLKKTNIFLVYAFLLLSFFSISYADESNPYSKYYKDLKIKSPKAIIYDAEKDEVIYEKGANEQSSIASVTKLMTAMVLLDSGLDLDEKILISESDMDTIKGTKSKLWVGSELSRDELLHIALIASDNRAASALSNSYPGGKEAFVKAMNIKAKQLDMVSTNFVDPTGLNKNNISTATDLVKLVQAANQYPLIRTITTTASYDAYIENKNKKLSYVNTNLLVRQGIWDIGISKTGYIQEAGKCLVMQTQVVGKPIVMVFLKSYGKLTRTADANRVKIWLEKGYNQGLFAQN